MESNASESAVGWCWSCGYPLGGLASTRCPECGRTFDPGNPRDEYDVLCPINVRPTPTEMARVGVVLTELQRK